MIEGVCSGIAEYLDIDPTVVRLLFVLFTFLGGGGVIVYLVLWIIMPEQPETSETIMEVKEKPAAPKKVAEPVKKPAVKKAPAKKPADAPKKTATGKAATAKSAAKTTTAKASSEAKSTTKKEAAPKPASDEEK